MEDMLGGVKRPPVRLRSLLSDFQTALRDEKQPKSRDDIISAMELEKEPTRFETAEANCKLDQLDQFDDVRVMKYIPGHNEGIRRTISVIPDTALKLHTFKTLVDEKERNIKNPFQRTRHSFKPVNLPECADKNSNLYRDLLIYIRVYRPARVTHKGQRLEKPVFAEEFQCLGSNLLTELRDKISCVCNKKRFFDISDHPTDELIDKKTDPGYFFITDTFYNDKRNPANADYSKTVRDWAKTAEGLNHLEFKVAEMERKCFLDLTISLGFPQLYHHHGNCEHVFVFSKIEFITPSSTICDPSAYPVLSSFSSFNTRPCNMCGQRAYVFIVEQSVRQLHDPAYLCSKCFYGYHYIDGKKIGQFKAYKVNDYEEEENVATDTNIANSANEEEEEEEDQISSMQASTSDKAFLQAKGGIDDDVQSLLTPMKDPQLSDDSDDQENYILIKTEEEE